MTYVNKVFAFPGNRENRLISDESTRARVWFFDIHAKNARPFYIPRIEFLELLDSKQAREIADPWAGEVVLEDAMSDAEKADIERVWPGIQLLAKHMPDSLQPRVRAELLRKLKAEGGPSRPTMMTAFRRYCQRGMRKDALRSARRHCGAPGKPRNSDKPLGRPRTLSPGAPMPITSALGKAIVTCAKRHYQPGKRTSWPNVYRRFKAELKAAELKAAGGDIAQFAKDYVNAPVPTLQQFVYHALKGIDPVALFARTKGWRKAQQMLRTLLSNSRNDARGIASRYIIDATKLDVHVVSRLDRNRIVGRPTLYIVTDVVTRLTVGFYLGLEPPSWYAATLALLNVFEDKVALCAKYGITIPSYMWPTGTTCVALLSDGGSEFLSKAATDAVGTLYQDLETAPPYRGDCKAVAERTFGLAQTAFGPYLPGYVEGPRRERGERDPRLDAAFDIEAIRYTVILQILAMNNLPRRDFDGDPDLIAAGVPYVPTQLWQAYEAQSIVDGYALPYDVARKILRPKRQVKIQKHAVRFAEGLYYCSDELLAQDWFQHVKINGTALTAGYDPGDMTTIEVWSPLNPSETFICHLTPHCARFANRTWAEINTLRRREQENKLDFYRKPDANALDPEAIATFVAGEQERTKKAQLAARKAEADTALSQSARLRNIKENRQAEMAHDQRLRSGAPIDGTAHRVAEAEPTPDPANSRLLDLLTTAIEGDGHDHSDDD